MRTVLFLIAGKLDFSVLNPNLQSGRRPNQRNPLRIQKRHKFHITAYLTKAVDLTRRAMMRDTTLERTTLKGYEIHLVAILRQS
jgi:hypothetical protein